MPTFNVADVARNEMKAIASALKAEIDNLIAEPASQASAYAVTLYADQLRDAAAAVAKLRASADDARQADHIAGEAHGNLAARGIL